MANLPETPDYADGIYQIETSDPVLGGPAGIANRQATQLGGRTAWLKNKIDDLLSGSLAVFKANRLSTARTLSITGAGNGSTSFDGSANASIALTLADSSVAAGTYPKVTVNTKGLVTAGASLAATDIPALDWSKITTGKPTTLAGYGIVIPDSGVTPGTYPKVTVNAKGDVTAGSALAAADIPSLDWSKITTGKPTTLAGYGIVLPDSGVTPGTYPKVTVNAKGDVSAGSALAAADIPSLDWSKITTGKPTTLAGYGIVLADSGVTPGTYPKVTVNAKGDVTAGSALAAADIPNLDWSKITTGKPTTLAGYGITNAQPLDTTLSALAAQVTAADKLIYATGVDSFAQTNLTPFARTLLDDANASQALATLGAASQASQDALGYCAAWNSTALSVSAGSTVLMRFQTKTADTLNAYNASAGVFTAPATGLYEFCVCIHGEGSSTSTSRYIDLYVNDAPFRRIQENDGAAARSIAGASGPISLTAGNTVKVYYGSSVAHTTTTYERLTWLTARRVK